MTRTIFPPAQHRFLSAFGLCFLALLLPRPGAAQLAPPSSGGVLGLAEALRPLGVHKRLLMIGAHPDDEDTELLTIVARDLGGEAAYLALNRGEGGQNLIGSELGEELGLLRSEEMMSARRLDGARQFFTRAYDFGYSKTLDDTWRHWSRDSLLKDVVRVIRRFRPQVIVAVFSGTPSDGHGQHQASGWLASEAWRLAGDPEVFPELAVEHGLEPWTALKFYRSTRFNPDQSTLDLSGGRLDPVSGRSFHQVAMRSRSQHRSQDMGRIQNLGPSTVRLRLVEDRTGLDSGDGELFTGVDDNLWAISEDSQVTSALRSYRARVDSARQMPLTERDLMGDLLERAWADLVRAMAGMSDDSEVVHPVLHDEANHLARAYSFARGIFFDVLADRESVVPGDTLVLKLLAWNTSNRTVSVLVSPAAEGARVLPDVPAGGPLMLAPGQIDSVFTALVPASATLDPYFLREPRSNGLYRWVESPGIPSLFDYATLPFEPPPVRGVLSIEVNGYPMTITREAAYRIADQAMGEIRRPVWIVPRLDVALQPAQLLLSRNSPGPRSFSVTVHNQGRTPVRGILEMRVPSGWPRVAPQAVDLEPGAEVRYAFDIHLPPGLAEGTFELSAVVTDELGREYRRGAVTVSYDHIRTRTLTRPASARLRVAEVSLPDLTRVGYIRGAADKVPEALESIGLPIAMIDDVTLARGDLSQFDAIVVGSRAYEINQVLRQHNDRLLEFTRAGGLLLVQYQQYQFFDGNFAPYPLSVGGRPLVEDGITSSVATQGLPNSHDRVADQTVPVTVLDPNDPSIQAPNRIDDADWDGWVQERGLYFARSWSESYRTPLEMHDPGEPPQQGSLLIAPLEEGTYVYTGISFFRQLPAGVPGAYRLFANLLALSHERGTP